MATVKFNDVEIHYDVLGDGEPLLLIAGMGGVGSYWQPQIESFAKHFRVITFDQRGTGRSTHSNIKYSVEGLAEDVLGLLDGIGIDRVHVCGHSTGGMIAQVLAVRFPERLLSLTLYGTRARTDSFTSRVMGMRRDILRSGNVELFVHSTPVFLFPSWWIVANQKVLEQMEAALLSKAPSSAILASRIEAVLHHDQAAHLGKVKVPTLVLCASDDFLTPPYYSEELAGLIENAQLQILDGGGHACSMTKPGPFTARVLDFLAGIVDETSPVVR